MLILCTALAYFGKSAIGDYTILEALKQGKMVGKIAFFTVIMYALVVIGIFGLIRLVIIKLKQR